MRSEPARSRASLLSPEGRAQQTEAMRNCCDDATIIWLMRPSRPLSVPEAASILGASDAYVRRLLVTQQLFGVKIGPVWAVYREDLDSFQRARRPPGRPPKAERQAVTEKTTRANIDLERALAQTDASRRKPRRK